LGHLDLVSGSSFELAVGGVYVARQGQGQLPYRPVSPLPHGVAHADAYGQVCHGHVGGDADALAGHSAHQLLVVL
jgi:hypothetical protein